MKNGLRYFSFLLYVLCLFLPSKSYGIGWEQVWAFPTTYAHFITSAGTHLASDYSDNKDGGIFRSTDGAASWKDCGVEDFWYNKFFETGDYIFAVGSSCRIARSNDDGETWTILDYSPLVSKYLPKGDLEGAACYAITELDGIIYIGDFSTGMVLQSSDYGDSWEPTDRDSLIFEADILDNVYNLVAYNGKIYSFGVFTIHTFDPKEGKWTELKDMDSNFMAVSTLLNGYLVCGRSMPNDTYNSPFLLYTDGNSWMSIDRPSTIDNNVRALHSENGVLFAANNGGPVWVTKDFGKTWLLVDGLPEFLYPLTLATDDTYLYVGVYSPIPTDYSSGVYRISKEELGIPAGITLPETEGNEVIVCQKTLLSDKVMEYAYIYDMSGKKLAEFKNVNIASLESLPHGEYIYSVIIEGKHISGRFSL